MSTVYSPVYSLATGWVLGVIEDHSARPLSKEEVEQAAARLNALAKRPEPVQYPEGRER